MALQTKGTKSTTGPARMRTNLQDPVSPRRVFRHISYPKRITKTAATYLHNIQVLLATYVPWMSHLHLCVYHIWALIWALSRPWRSPMCNSLMVNKPFLYCPKLQHCFLIDWIRTMLFTHNWRGPWVESGVIV
jgi:hypothetical protein